MQNNLVTIEELYKKTCEQNWALSEKIGMLKAELRYYRGYERKKTPKVKNKVILMNRVSD